MAFPIRSSNSVELLLDGEEIIGALRDGFTAVATAARGTPNTYARLAFWLIQEDMTLGDRTHRHLNMIVNHIRDVIVAGFDADIILWYPGNPLAKRNMDEQVEEHDRLARQIRTIEIARAGTATPTAPLGNARVYKERYEGPPEGSMHQKIAIFSVNGQRTAVVGGLNLAERYFDTTAHTHVNFWDGEDAGWHDTAVRLKGKVTDDIEAEWMRRWNRLVSVATSKITLKNLRARLKSRHLEDGAVDRTRAWTVLQNDTAQTPYQAGSTGNVHESVRSQVLLTRKSGSTRTREILDGVLERINNATQRIYVENNQITDPQIARAIYERMAAQPGLEVAIVTNPNGGGCGYLTRRAWLHMALRHPSCRSVTYVKDDGTLATVNRGTTGPAWEIHDRHRATNPTEYQWLQEDDISFTGPSGGTITRKFEKIERLDVDFHFYTPAVHVDWDADDKPEFRTLCIHSKLMVIDEWVLCGSSNWTYRSMQYDGEIQTMNDNRTMANQVLARLLGHYETVTTPVTLANIETVAQVNADAVIAAEAARTIVNANQFMLMPIEYKLDEIGEGLSLYWSTESPKEGSQLTWPYRHWKGLTEELPNWRWW